MLITPMHSGSLGEDRHFEQRMEDKRLIPLTLLRETELMLTSFGLEVPRLVLGPGV